MIGREAFAEVLLNLLNADRKALAQEALAEIIRHMDWDGTCRLSRLELAELLGGVADSNLSAALSELAAMRVIIRRRGVGGRLQIVVNPIFATMLREQDRERMQAEAPPIRRADRTSVERRRKRAAEPLAAA